MSLYADVLLPLPLDGLFTYAVPPGMSGAVGRGCRVIVQFGNKRLYSALVLDLHDRRPDYPTKEIAELLDTEPIVTLGQVKLWRWIADYYLCTLGEVYRAALPGGLKLESETVVGIADDYDPGKATSKEERLVMDALESKTVQPISSLQKSTGIRNILPVINSLITNGAVLIWEQVRRTYKPKTIVYVRVAERYLDEEAYTTALGHCSRYPKQKAILTEYARMANLSAAITMRNRQILREVTRVQLLEAAQASPSSLKLLTDKGILESYSKAVDRIPTTQLPQDLLKPALHPLSEAQQKAYDEILSQWKSRKTCLLKGVTGSGKTEIYIHLITDMLRKGKQVLYMLPEIVLTTQLTERLRKVFGDSLGVYHSRYPDAERVEVYRKMLSDHPYEIVVGVRSSIFLPFRNLGLVIIDEEHETSFKQSEPAPRYHARNAGLVLASMNDAYTLLGSATPSMESFYNACAGKYGYVSLDTRYGDISLPSIEIVDMRECARKRLLRGAFSPRLLSAVREALDHHRQVILFQNRRGFAPIMECRMCGWTPRCNKCDVSLTLHRNMRQLACHYCGATYPIPARCPNCDNTELHSTGYGTERLADALQALFPEARIARMDLDTTRSRTSYENILHDFQKGRTDILVGTQMVTKGLDFEPVSTVGILNASTMLNQPDFRSYERAFQLMEQVAGRAGRHGAQGHVILQTYDSDAEVVRQVVEHDYRAMYDSQMEERRLFGYPPFCKLIFIYVKHREDSTADMLSGQMARSLRMIFGDRILGPDSPPISRVQGMYIRKIILKIETGASLAEIRHRLREARNYFLSDARYKSAIIYYDVD